MTSIDLNYSFYFYYDHKKLRGYFTLKYPLKDVDILFFPSVFNQLEFFPLFGWNLDLEN